MGGDRIPQYMDILICEECAELFRRGGVRQTPDGKYRCPRCFGINTRDATPEEIREVGA